MLKGLGRQTDSCPGASPEKGGGAASGEDFLGQRGPEGNGEVEGALPEAILDLGFYSE